MRQPEANSKQRFVEQLAGGQGMGGKGLHKKKVTNRNNNKRLKATTIKNIVN